ncbi:MAG: hypothetical protein J1E60_07055 [Christensenellaceae bacterium]|nr:hypothetical protein [Christensenellaceae bacterium]
MNENPYSGLLSIIRGKDQSSDTYACNQVIGRVVSVTPLIINAAGLELDEDDIIITTSAGATVTVEGETAVFGSAVFPVGSSVLLLTPDFQKFYLIAGAN